MKKKVYLISLVSAIVFSLQGFAQNLTYDPSVFIDININSGNPTCPFPQFVEYPGGGKSLAKYNAEGVTHADMEKTLREAYEIMMHRCRYEGTYCGVRYISFNRDDVAGNYGTFVSEGDGYALLAAAIFADQKTFNGLYMWIHDIRFSGVERFRDGRSRGTTANDYAGPYLAAWKDKTFDAAYGSDSHSATDGDVDIAMAMLIAYKQWGEWMMQDGTVVKDSRGNPISLKYETQRVVGALVDTLGQWDKGSGALTGMLCGVVGIDGYEKRGNSWGELTRWRFTNEANAMYPGVNGPYNGGPNLYSIYGGNYIDYDAPSYFEEFWRWLKNGDGVDENNEKVAPWEIHQFKRAAASGNWLNQQAYNQGYNASIGQVQMNTDGSPTFGVYVDGEDFRYCWRHVLDYLWHGDADYDWDPKTHQVIEGQTNNSERLMGVRHAKLLENPSNSGTQLCSKMGASPDPGQPLWFGVSQIPQQWRLDGGITSAYHTNYSVGAGATAAVASENLSLIADIYRQCEIMWDGNNTAAKLDPEERYIGSTPKYFHGWFRTLGMLVCSGNLIAPEQMTPKANMKVYMSVDKTYAYEGDKVGYTVQYRNYGTVDAKDVKIQTVLDDDYTFVSATKGGVYDEGSRTITWNVGTVKGFKSGGLAATMDSVAFTVKITSLDNSRVCETSTITGSNFEEWVSNEYPNHATYTMERNCVDVLANRSLVVEKTANRTELNPNDKVTFTVNFENVSSDDAWMNGGRDNVRISYGNYYMKGNAYQFYHLYRFWNDSYEAYINMNNYRVSYFMYDAAAQGLYDAASNPTGWTFIVDNQNDLDKYGYNPTSGPITFAYQKIPQGEDQYGKWNQRLMIRFADVLMAPSTHVYDKLDSQYLLHKGVWGPGFIRARLASNPASDMSTRVQDDWSFSTDITAGTIDGQGETFTLITPCWANYEDLGYEIDNYSRHTCSSPTSKLKNYDRVLVEEFDGYTWRRIQGRGPLPGKEAYNVTIVDTIPKELKFDAFTTKKALGVEATYTAAPAGASYSGIVKWTIPEMLVGESGKLVYSCVANDIGCPNADDTYYINAAWIYSQTDSPDSSSVELMTSCTELPPYVEPQNSLFKNASQETAVAGDVISYEVKYVNTTGTIVDENCSSNANWIGLGGKSVPNVSNGTLPLNTNGSSAYFFGPKYSYGKDGAVYLTFSGCNSTTQELYFVMRYVSGTPGSSNFKGIAMKLFINRDGQHNFGYELYSDGKLIQKEGSSWADALQFAGSSSNPVFKFVLNGDHLYMYVNDAENEWTSVMKDWSGLTTNPGNFGLYVNSNGNGQTAIDNFRTELDYAYDIKVTDAVPSCLSNISSISGSGTYSSGTITWPLVAGPLAPNEEISYTFDATVDECNGYISNYAYATVYGQDKLTAVNSIKCGATVCPDPPTVTSPVTYCKGETAFPLVANGKKLKWYDENMEILSTTTAPTPSTDATGTTTYYVTQTSGCESDPTEIKVVVIETEKPEVEDVTLCKNDASVSALTATGTDLKWYNSSEVQLTDAPVPDVSEETTYSYFVTQTIDECESDKAEIKVTVGALAKPTVEPAISYCQGLTSEPLTATADGGTLQWYTTATGGTASTTAPTPSTDEVGHVSYYVSQLSGTCESERSEIVVTINANPVSSISATSESYCGENSSVALTIVPDDSNFDMSSAAYQWYKDGAKTSTNESISDATAGTYKCVLSLDGCSYETEDVVISQYDNPEYTITGDGSYCPESTEKTPVVITFTKGTAPFTFTDAVLGEVTTDESVYTVENPVGGTYKLTALTDAHCSMTATAPSVAVVDLETPDLTLSPIPGVCAGSSTVDISKYVTAGAGTISYTTDKGTVSNAGVLSGLTTAGEYNVSVTVTGTVAPYCTNTEVATVTVFALPTIEFEDDMVVCSESDLVLKPTIVASTTTYTTTWSDEGANFLNSKTLEQPTFNAEVTAQTNYALNLSVTDDNGCSSEKSTSIKVNALPTATLSAASDFVCKDAELDVVATLSDAGSGNGEWTNATKVSNSEGKIVGADYSAGTMDVSYVYTDENSCVSKPAILKVTVVETPATPTLPDISQCLNGDEKPLTAVGIANPLWYDASETLLTSAPTPKTDVQGTVFYYVSQVVDGCESQKQKLTVTTLSDLEVTIVLPNDGKVCEGNPMDVSVAQSFASYSWSGTAAEKLSSKTMANPKFLESATVGTYELKVDVVDAGGCKGKASKSIFVNPVPEVSLSASKTAFCVSETTPQTISATVLPDGIAGTYTWSGEETSATASTTTFTPSTKTAGTHDVKYQFESSEGCVSDWATITMTVNDLPAITLNPSKTDICVSGENSADVTMIPSKTTGTFNYSVNNGATIAEDGTFSASNGAGEYEITLVYTDENSCSNTVSTNVTIHDLPDVEFVDAPATACYNATNVSLTVNPPTTSATKFSFFGTTGATSSVFNPSTSAVGENTITYTYMDNFGCQNSQTHTIDVIKVLAPTIEAPNPKTVTIDEFNQVVEGETTTMTAVPNVATDKVIWKLPSEEVEGASYTYTATEYNVGSYQYFVKEQRMIEGSACYSDSTLATLVISSCIAKSPVVTNVDICLNDVDAGSTEKTVELTASHAKEGANKTISWFSEADKDDIEHATPMANGSETTTWTTTVSTASATTYTFYVAEYDATPGKECWSLPTPITIKVNDLPTVDINDIPNNGYLCYADGSYTATGSINGVQSTAGTWSVESDAVTVDAKTGVIDTKSAGMNDGTYNLIYSYTDGIGCQNSATKEFKIEYPNVPQSDGYLGIRANPVPVEISVKNESLEVVGATVRWYVNANDATAAQTASSWNPTFDPSIVQSKTYYLTQEVNGCESEKGTSLVKIVECPFEKPNVGKEIVLDCIEENGKVENLTASLPSSTTVAADSWAWFAEDDLDNPLANSDVTSFDANISTDAATEKVFYVAYYATQSPLPSCLSEKTKVTVTVNELPVITITDVESALCYEVGDFQMSVDVNGKKLTDGQWSIKDNAAEISQYGIFDTKQKGQVDGEYTVVYSYTDLNTTCSNTDELTINVEYPEIPSAEDKNLLKSETPIVLTAENIENTTGHIGTPNWYVFGVVNSDHSADWTTPDNPNTVHTSQYQLSQTVNGCESEKVLVNVAVSNCPFKAPVAENVPACMTDASVNELTAELPSSTTVEATSWIWYDADMNVLSSTTNSYQSNVSTATVGETKFYVSYNAIDPNTTLECESAKAEVSVVVKPLPEVAFDATNKTLVCQDKGDVVWNVQKVNTHENGIGTGVWTLDYKMDNGMSQKGVFNPTTFGEVSGSYRVTYTYTDGAGCVDSAVANIDVQFTPVPVVTDFAALTEQNKTVVVSATPLTSDATISWYDVNGSLKSSASDYETNDKGNVVVHKSYFATQTINTCQSKKAEAKVDIIDCPVPKPVVVQPDDICDYDAVPELTASFGDWTSGTRPENASVFRFYDVETEGTALAENTEGTYVPTVDNTKSAVYTYWVAEYNSDVFPSACESKRSKVTLTVKKIEKPTINSSKQTVCFGFENPSYTAMGQGPVQWYESEPTYPATDAMSVGNPYVPTFTEVGTHSVWVTQMVDGCLSEAVSKDFEILAIPERPEVVSATVCEDAPKDTLKAIPSDGGTITWYANENKTGIVSKANNMVPQDNIAGVYTYYAVQTVNGCMSDTISVPYTVLPLPTIPIVKTDAVSCDYDDTHELMVDEKEGITVAWYSSADTTSLIDYGNKFVHTIEKSGTFKYFVRQIENGCVGNYVTASFSVVAQPQLPKVSGDVICPGEVAGLYTDGAKDMWYSDEDRTVLEGQGYTLTVLDLTKTKTYFVVREKSGCFSDVAEATVEVIQQPVVTITQSGEAVDQIRRCEYDDEKYITVDVSPKMTDNDYVEWFIFPGNIKLKDVDSVLLSEYVNLSSSVTSNNSYTIRAQYNVKNEYKNMYCASVMDTVKYSTYASVRTPIVLSNVICQGEKIEPMFAFGTPNITWISLDGVQPLVFHGQTYEFTPGQNSLEIGSYRFQVYDYNEETGCYSDTAEVSLTLAPAAETKIFGRDSVCMGSVGESYYTKYDAESQYFWKVTGDNLNYSKDANSTSVRYIDWMETGVDTIMVYEQTWAGCEGFDTLVVKVAPEPVARFVWSMPGASNIVELVDSTLQDSLWTTNEVGEPLGLPISYNMAWNYGHAGTDESQIDTLIPFERRHFPFQEGGYLYGYNCPILTVTNDFGCTSSYTECIFVNIASSLYVPTAFSPSNPAHSVRTFQPKGFNLAECEISVYDKWGNLIWFSNAVEDGMFVGYWDGTYDGKMMKSDVYVWKMEATFLDGQKWQGFDVGNGKKSKFGSVTLIR